VAARDAEVAQVLATREEWLAATVADVADDATAAASLCAVVTGLVESARPPREPDRVLDHAVAALARPRRRSPR
jgi:hypothetical protein